MLQGLGFGIVFLGFNALGFGVQGFGVSGFKGWQLGLRLSGSGF